MPRIQGVDIPNDKPAYISLGYLYGIGRHTAIQICEQLDLDPLVKASDIGEEGISQINNLLDKSYTIEGALRRQVAGDISRLREIGCYRGIRHRRGLPVRGQRTQTNARTRKGGKKTVAGKKGVKDARH